jgi:DNA mismatch repair protein MutS2
LKSLNFKIFCVFLRLNYLKVIYPDNFENKIGFTRIREMLSELCLCDLGRRNVEEVSFLTHFDEVQELVFQTEEFRQICLMEPSFPVQHFIDATPFLKKARLEGAFLDVYEIFDLKRSLDSIRAILSFFKGKDHEKYPQLRKIMKEVKVFPVISERIDAILTKNGEIKDNASPELGAIRREMHEKAASVAKVMQRILKHAQSEGLVDAETSLTLRDGRPVIPVNSTYKRKIQGIVHDESATGKTSFIEPAETVHINNAIRELEFAERREIIKILTAFTDLLRPYLEELAVAYGFLGKIDFIRAKALLAIKINAVLPSLFNQQEFNWVKAVHPLLYLTLTRENRDVVPLDISLKPQGRMLLISGPNAGGKSVCLKTVGLIQYMLQCGLLVPVSENSEMGIFQNIFIDIGDEQSIENDLSTYSSHLFNMKYFLRNTSTHTLILIDEFGTGTEPMLGGAIAEAILAQLNEKGTYGIITTHYTNLKHYASKSEGVVNGAMLYDNHLMQPLFKLEIGQPGSSFAFEIARKIGLPEEVLQDASSKIGQDYVDFDKFLREIARDKRYWESKRERVRQLEKKLDELVGQNSKELEQISKERKVILEKAKSEAKEVLASANRQIENTIRQIRENQAEKEKTKEARKSVEEFRKKLDEPSADEEFILKKIEKLKKREEQAKTRNPKEQQSPETAPAEKEHVIKKGDKVKLFGQDSVGEVLDVNGKNFLVAFGQMITSLQESRIEKISNNEFKKASQQFTKNKVTDAYNTYDRKLNFKNNLDVRGQRAEEALQKVQELLDEAVMLNVSEVRILHGKGNGILRHMIREYLATVLFIKSFRDEQIEKGGTGITVVEID